MYTHTCTHIFSQLAGWPFGWKYLNWCDTNIDHDKIWGGWYFQPMWCSAVTIKGLKDDTTYKPRAPPCLLFPYLVSPFHPSLSLPVFSSHLPLSLLSSLLNILTGNITRRHGSSRPRTGGLNSRWLKPSLVPSTERRWHQWIEMSAQSPANTKRQHPAQPQSVQPTVVSAAAPPDYRAASVLRLWDTWVHPQHSNMVKVMRWHRMQRNALFHCPTICSVF